MGLKQSYRERIYQLDAIFGCLSLLVKKAMILGS